jgi:signal transduction histidine kinase/CheY-like chemotaxis protein
MNTSDQAHYKTITKLLVQRIALVALIILLISLVVQAAHLQIKTKAQFKQLIEQISDSSIPMMASALWDIEPEILQDQVNRLSKRPEIGFICLQSSTGKIFEAGDKALNNKSAHQVLKIKRPGIDGGQLGTLKIVLDPNFFWQEFARKVIEISLEYLLLITSICMLIFFMVRKDLAQPLSVMASFANSLNSENLTKPLKLGKDYREHPYEIAELRSGFNKLQKSLLKHIEYLNELIVERTTNQERLELANQESEAANIAKSQFLATISHELRTPLNGILGVAQLLQTENLSEPKRIEYSKLIIDSSKALNILVDDLLDITQIQANKLSLKSEPCDIESLTFNIATFFEQYANSKNLTITLGLKEPRETLYRTDPLRLRQMISNLVSNAIKFTDSGSIEIKFEQLEHNGAEAILKFSVTDTGIGIPKDKIKLLFERFSQVDSSNSRKFMGAGLGLAIVRSLSERMGGHVGVESTEGIGSCFWFTIQAIIIDKNSSQGENCPINRLPIPVNSEYVKPLITNQEERQVIMVVEDNPINQKILCGLLESMRLPAKCFNNGYEAIKAIEHEQLTPKLILMDIQMPLMDGLEATKVIREMEKGSSNRVPIIGLTAGLINQTLSECIQAGMDDLLLKPVDLDSLRSMISERIS